MSTLEQQLDALIAENRLGSISLSRIARGDGTFFWSVYTQGDGKCGSNKCVGKGVREALTLSLADLNELRAPPAPAVPELASLAA